MLVILCNFYRFFFTKPIFPLIIIAYIDFGGIFMILSCQGISKSFGEKVILNDASFHIEEREKAALIGNNGAGKTTLLRIIMNEISAVSGRFRWWRSFGSIITGIISLPAWMLSRTWEIIWNWRSSSMRRRNGKRLSISWNRSCIRLAIPCRIRREPPICLCF